MNAGTVDFIIYYATSRYERGYISSALVEMVERAIRETEEDGKTPERYELLKIWRDIRGTV